MTENHENGRRGKNKARTGCITCKFRRVKCDETKPFCLRCTKFGRKCDGYGGPKVELDKKKGRKGGGVVAIMPRPLLSLYSPKLTVPGNADERRYFHLFSQATSDELRGYFDSTFWAQTALQTSLTEPSIRHAVSAIASLSMMAEDGQKSFQPRGINKVKDEHYRFGIEQYNMAIASLRARLASKDNALRTALIACILFVCIEAIQGDQVAASGQVHGGLNLMQQVQRHRLEKNEGFEQPIIEDEIVQMYANINVQSFFLVFSQIPHHPPVGDMSTHMQESQHHLFSSSMPRLFTSVSEAKRALDLILNSIVQFFTSSMPSTDGKVEKYAQHHALLRQWESAFEPLLTRAKAASIMDLKLKLAPVVLSTYYRVARIVLAGSFGPEETVYDSAQRDFVSIISSCRSVLDALTGQSYNGTLSLGNHPRPRFSFEVGIVPPLYVVGSKCRDPVLRRQAIELLKIYPVQEGLWEPLCAGLVCEWMMTIEERGLVGGPPGGKEGFVPESSRVRLTGMQCELGKRRVWVQCKGVVPETVGGLVKSWENTITW